MQAGVCRCGAGRVPAFLLPRGRREEAWDKGIQPKKRAKLGLRVFTVKKSPRMGESCTGGEGVQMQVESTHLPTMGQVKKSDTKEIAFKNFVLVAHRRAWTAQSLADRFRGRIENPAEFFHRVLDGKSPDAIIPYRSVIEFFFAAAQENPAPGNTQACACGCGRTVFDRKRYALPGCKTRTARRHAAEGRDSTNRKTKAVDFVDVRQRQLGTSGRLPFTAIQHGAERKADVANG